MGASSSKKSQKQKGKRSWIEELDNRNQRKRMKVADIIGKIYGEAFTGEETIDVNISYKTSDNGDKTVDGECDKSSGDKVGVDSKTDGENVKGEKKDDFVEDEDDEKKDVYDAEVTNIFISISSVKFNYPSSPRSRSSQ